MKNWLLLLSLGLAACPSTPTDDDDSTASDDDDSAGDDDDATAADDDDAAACDAPAPPYAVEVAGVATASITFDDLLCTPYGGDVWNIAFRTGDDSWSLRLATGVLAEGTSTTAGNSVSLRKPAEQLEFTSGQTGSPVVIDVESYATSPCGTFTVGSLGDNAGGTVDVTPQPIPFRCP
jgi:hypothetical protein